MKDTAICQSYLQFLGHISHVLDGGFSEGGDELRKHSWLRLPVGSKLSAIAGPKGAKVWMKTGHLPHAKPPKV
ncbi:MAG: hypothetical protein JKX71_09300 [Amylibacter sp.]|nr:hypothetical protein [Amylibacter sp.]